MGKFINNNKELLEQRQQKIYDTPGDTRDVYFRDYTRILHSNAYRRLKHKTQVYFNVNNDHICTRIEHVSHVAAVSRSIAIGLGLNCSLTDAIALGHDIGHSPFGHHGETVLNDLMDKYLSDEYKKVKFGEGNNKLFWHEKNGLRFVDNIELLADPLGQLQNLNLTYAVRDGILSHCGEIDQNALIPREEVIDLRDFKKPGQFQPCTWEGCVVKISDKIAYLGRDIEDAITLKMLSNSDLTELKTISNKYIDRVTLNTTSIMHNMITDICINSTPEKGICLGEKNLELLNKIKEFNYRVIYKSDKFAVYKEYASLVLKSIFEKLYQVFDGEYTMINLNVKYGCLYPKLTKGFIDWLCRYCTNTTIEKYDLGQVGKYELWQNEKIYGDLKDKNIYVQAIVDYISGMTDSYAIALFNELISFS